MGNDVDVRPAIGQTQRVERVPAGLDVVDLSYPFTGRWSVQNSPADRVPSHGTSAFASSYAIDFVPVDVSGRTAPLGIAGLVRPEAAHRFPGFGRPVLAPIDGTVVAAHDTEEDHDAFRGLPSIGYVISQRQRVARGWPALAGNHVAIRTTSGACVVLCHLRSGSVTVEAGARVHTGHVLGECGNSGNSTEPHLHLQAIDRWHPANAKAIPISFEGALPGNRAVVEV